VDFSADISGYQRRLCDLVQAVKVEEVNTFITSLLESYYAGKRVYIFGNGGSGATASHMAQDWNKGTRLCEGRPDGKRLRVICLNNNVPEMLAYANDIGFEDVFAGQLDTHLDEGDLVIAISGSGNSKNIVKAVEYANAHGSRTFGLCGAYNRTDLADGGKLRRLAHQSLHVPSPDMQLIEDVHHAVCHLALQAMCKYLNQPSPVCQKE